ncbi:MAG: hypothetical protein HFH87_04550 [Lachnospiraceae bacterium]|nr:hypothetical protein [Lachnospiraceae bacterium]
MDSEKRFQEICKCPLCDSDKKAFMYMSRGVAEMIVLVNLQKKFLLSGVKRVD